MKKSALFQGFAVFFLLVSIYFGYQYFTSDRSETNIPKLLLCLSNLVFAIAMLLFSRNKGVTGEN
jgi:hypothetical protein